jgi:hypothetical protein
VADYQSRLSVLAGGPVVVRGSGQDTVQMECGDGYDDGWLAELTRHEALALANALVDAVEGLDNSRSGATPE